MDSTAWMMGSSMCLFRNLFTGCMIFGNRVWQKKTAKPAVEEPPTRSQRAVSNFCSPNSNAHLSMQIWTCFPVAPWIKSWHSSRLPQSWIRKDKTENHIFPREMKSVRSLPLTMSPELLDCFDWDSQEFTYCWQTSEDVKGTWSWSKISPGPGV